MKNVRFIIVLQIVVALGSCFTAVAARADGLVDSASYQRVFADATRAAASRVLPAVVGISPVQASDQSVGDVSRSAGTSGLVVDPEGWIATSDLTLGEVGDRALVTLGDGRQMIGTVNAIDTHRGWCLLRVDTDTPLPAIRIASDREGRSRHIGQTMVAVGRYGTEAVPIVSRGILSAVDRLEGVAIQIDARVTPPCYGGPVVDLAGRVHGLSIPAVGTAGAENPTDWYDSGVAFAVDAASIARNLPRMKSGENVRRGLVGIVPASKDIHAADTRLAAVRPRSPAAEADIRGGDEVLAINDVRTERFATIRQVLGRYDAGDEVVIRIAREDEVLERRVVLAEEIPPIQPQQLGLLFGKVLPEDIQTGDDQDEPSSRPENAPEDQADPSTSMVAVTAIIPDGPASAAGLRAGDVLLSIGENEDLRESSVRAAMMVAAPETAIPIRYRRDDQPMTASVQPRPVAGTVQTRYPATWRSKTQAGGDQDDVAKAADKTSRSDWPITAIDMVDASGVAAVLGPAESKDADDEAATNLGLLIVLAKPGEKEPTELLQGWTTAATEAGVVVAVLCSGDETRWRLSELDTIASLTALVKSRFPVNTSAVAIAPLAWTEGESSGAADTMALAAAIANSELFGGVAVRGDTRPPAIRLRENSAEDPLAVLLRLPPDAESPGFAETLTRSGYPMIRSVRADDAELLRWTRLLQVL